LEAASLSETPLHKSCAVGRKVIFKISLFSGDYLTEGFSLLHKGCAVRKKVIFNSLLSYTAVVSIDSL
jgi:hypothetical protein